jgi:hypothetical protein
MPDSRVNALAENAPTSWFLTPLRVVLRLAARNKLAALIEAALLVAFYLRPSRRIFQQ